MTYRRAQEKGWQVKKGERVWSILHLTITTMRHSRDGRGTKMQMKLALSDAELLALEARLTPHLLFNCFNSIRGMIVEDAVQPLDTGQVLITRREFDLAPKIHAGANSRGNAGPMESMEDRTLKLYGLPPFPQSLEIAKAAISHIPTTQRLGRILTFLSGAHRDISRANSFCRPWLEMSGEKCHVQGIGPGPTYDIKLSICN